MGRSSHWPKGIAAGLALVAVSLSHDAPAATLAVGPGKPYPVPSAAAAVVHDGDRVTIAAGSYSDCAVWKANNLTIEGASSNTTVISGAPCSGKALFVIQGNAITILGLAFTGAHVDAFNGAGIRAEGGDLTIDHVRFSDNEDGLLAGPLAGKTIIIRYSEFIGNGSCAGAGGCAHGVYVGNIGLLRVEHSRFFGTRAGHDIKSRSQRTEVLGCDLSDGANGTSSFAIDVPNGGSVLIENNRIQKGPKSENRTAAVMIGEEGVTQSTPEIVVEHNTLVVEGGYRPYLLDNRTMTAAVLRGNVLQGSATALRGPGTVN